VLSTPVMAYGRAAMIWNRGCGPGSLGKTETHPPPPLWRSRSRLVYALSRTLGQQSSFDGFKVLSGDLHQGRSGRGYFCSRRPRGAHGCGFHFAVAGDWQPAMAGCRYEVVTIGMGVGCYKNRSVSIAPVSISAISARCLLALLRCCRLPVVPACSMSCATLVHPCAD